jgi:hypothetical protein
MRGRRKRDFGKKKKKKSDVISLILFTSNFEFIRLCLFRFKIIFKKYFSYFFVFGVTDLEAIKKWQMYVFKTELCTHSS